MPPDRPTTGPDTGDEHGTGARARLFDADRTDRRLDLEDAVGHEPGSTSSSGSTATPRSMPTWSRRLGARLKLGSASARALTGLGTTT